LFRAFCHSCTSSLLGCILPSIPLLCREYNALDGLQRIKAPHGLVLHVPNPHSQPNFLNLLFWTKRLPAAATAYEIYFAVSCKLTLLRDTSFFCFVGPCSQIGVDLAAARTFRASPTGFLRDPFSPLPSVDTKSRELSPADSARKVLPLCSPFLERHVSYYVIYAEFLPLDFLPGPVGPLHLPS